MNRESARDQIARSLLEQVGPLVDVSLVGDRIVLRGAVDSAGTRAFAESIAARYASGHPVESELEVDERLVAGASEIDDEPEPLPQDAETSEEAEEDALHFPPTDPVVRVGAHGEVQVLGGFSQNSLESVEVEASAEDDIPGDEALAEAVRRELLEDASTTDLEVRVHVRGGVVVLHGRVSSLEDVDNAESVAASVPGVVEVREELEVSGL
jgi:osmotically-inducible protein OsmY